MNAADSCFVKRVGGPDDGARRVVTGAKTQAERWVPGFPQLRRDRMGPVSSFVCSVRAVLSWGFLSGCRSYFSGRQAGAGFARRLIG